MSEEDKLAAEQARDSASRPEDPMQGLEGLVSHKMLQVVFVEPGREKLPIFSSQTSAEGMMTLY